MPSVLLVNDDEEELELMKKEFEKLNTEVSVATTEEALDKFETVIPDLVVMDYSENEEVVIEHSKRMVDLDSTVCIFGLTSKEKSEVATHSSYAWGARTLITKPENLDDDDERREFMKTVVGACNELEKDTCIKCWLSQRYDTYMKEN